METHNFQELFFNVFYFLVKAIAFPLTWKVCIFFFLKKNGELLDLEEVNEKMVRGTNLF